MAASGVGAAVTSVGGVALALVILMEQKLSHILAVHASGFAAGHSDNVEAGPTNRRHNPKP